MADAYSDTALDHFNNPRNVGVMEDVTVVGKAENPVSGASLELWLRIDGKGIIKKATFRAHGCTATIAAGSVVTELLPGRKLTTEGVVSRDELAIALDGLPPTRKHAYRLVTDAIRSAAALQDESMTA